MHPFYFIAGNNRIRKVDAATHIITTVVGNGVAGYSGDGGRAESAELNYPYSVCFDKMGNFYIADQNNYRIRKVDTNGYISTYAGTGTFGISTDGGIADTTEVGQVFGLCVDTADNLHFTDGNRVRKINTVTKIISTVAGNGSTGTSGNGGLATGAEFENIVAICFDQKNNLYTADMYGESVRMINALGYYPRSCRNRYSRV